MINWSEKIKASDTEIDLFDTPLYTRKFNKTNYKTVYGYKVEFPVEPPDEECINYGLPVNDQIFRRTHQPNDLEYWDLKEKEQFIADERHRRKNGYWMFIGGEKYYIPGLFIFFLVYWTLQTGKKALFRMSDLDFFHIWMHVVRSPWIFGLVIFKCRRIGDTEKALCIIYEYASRVKNTLNGLSDCRKFDEILLTYARLTFAHERMSFFMKPINRGSSNPKAKLEFKHPETKESVKKIHNKNSKDVNSELEFEFDALGSEIIPYSSTPSATDGKRHGRLYFDEFGKPKTLNPIDAWRFGKLSLMDLITEEIIGKALFTSTIEQEPGTKSKFLEISQEMWDNSNPEILNEKGQTTSGLIRIVRGALERGKPDRFGRTDKERLRKEIESQKKFLLENRKWKDLIEFGRQNCIDEQDIFASMTGDSNFNVENLTQREHRLRYEKGLAKWVRGNFHWVNGKKFGDVYWQPNENGRFVVSGHPKDWGLKANAKSAFSKKPKPKNIHAFCAGIDPVSQKDVLEKNPSKGGLVIKRKFDPTFDSGKFDEDGDPLNGGEQFSTNRYVCALLWRWAEPTQNYEDWAMALIYYGSDFLIEKNHSAGFQTYMEGADLDGYYMDNSKGVKNHAGQVESWGISANEKSIDYYFSLLSTITNKWWNTIDIPVILDQLKSMNVENRGSKDVGVAAGICEIAAQRDLPKPKDREKESNTHFTEIIV